MAKSVGIVGYGVVGQAMHRMFEPAFNVHIYDPAKFGLYSHLSGTWKLHMPECDLTLVCVGTPEGLDRRADLTQIREVMSDLAQVPVKRRGRVCIKSTVPPGTTDALSREFGLQLCFSPEYIGEPVNFVPPWLYPDPRNPQTHSFCTVGGERSDAVEVMSFFKLVMATSARFNVCTALEAELAKYMENTYLAAKVAFCTEWSEICRVHGADYDVVRELWLSDPRVDPDHTLVHADSPGFGGRCLPKDLSAVIAACADRGYDASILSEIRRRNDEWRCRADSLKVAAE